MTPGTQSVDGPNPEILIGTVLFEKNRWTSDKVPTFKVSDLAPALRKAGFAGLELWENHVALADEQEKTALSRMPLPVKILNSYCAFDDNGAAGRRLAADFVRRFDADAVKFNFGNERSLTAQYQANLSAWLDTLPKDCRALCECHGNTVAEEPVRAADILRPFAERIGIIVHAFAVDDDTPMRSWINHFGAMIKHVHVASSFAPGVGFASLRNMEARVRRRVAMLADVGFDGTWAIEFTAGVNMPGENIQGLLVAATEDVHLLREVLAG